jgi:hypothetical protein
MKALLPGAVFVGFTGTPLLKQEETGANTETEKQFLFNIYTELLKDVDAKHDVVLAFADSFLGLCGPESRRNASNTLSFMRWRICSNPRTMPASLI